MPFAVIACLPLVFFLSGIAVWQGYHMLRDYRERKAANVEELFGKGTSEKYDCKHHHCGYCHTKS